MDLVSKVAISGKICSGKTTISNHLVDIYGHTRISSAKHLKSICGKMATYNLFNNLFNDSLAVNKSVLNTYNDSLKEEIRFITNNEEEFEKAFDLALKLRKDFSHVENTEQKTDDVRNMLQEVARVMLDNIRKDIWINSMFKSTDPSTPFLVHDDLRYPAEYDILREHGFVMVRLDIEEDLQAKRIKKLYGKIDPKRITHISETLLDNHEFDYNIDASLPLEEVLKQIDEIIKL